MNWRLTLNSSSKLISMHYQNQLFQLSWLNVDWGPFIGPPAQQGGREGGGQDGKGSGRGWSVEAERWGGVLPRAKPQFLCNQPIVGCVCIAPTTNSIALRPRKTEPNHSAEETPVCRLLMIEIGSWRRNAPKTGTHRQTQCLAAAITCSYSEKCFFLLMLELVTTTHSY